MLKRLSTCAEKIFHASLSIYSIPPVFLLRLIVVKVQEEEYRPNRKSFYVNDGKKGKLSVDNSEMIEHMKDILSNQTNGEKGYHLSSKCKHNRLR